MRQNILRVKDTFDISLLFCNNLFFFNILHIPILLVGTKCDLEHERIISTEKGQKLAGKLL